MKHFLFSSEKAVRYGLVLLGISVSVALAQTKTYVVDAPGKLSTIATQIQSAPAGGTHIVQFKTYVNVGAFNLTSLTADSLIFQRAEESAEVVEFTGTLFQMRNVSAAVVFRNLAFKVKTGSSIFLDGAAPASPNKNLSIDSCQLFGDDLNTTFIGWNGATDVGSRIVLQRTIIFGLQGTNPKIDLTADTAKVLNCYLNYPGILSGAIPKILELKNTTSNRVQFSFNGSRTATYSLRNNLFAHPPGKNKLPGTLNKFVMDVQLFAAGTAFNNSRFSTWFGFDIPANDVHSDASNISTTPFGDTTAQWEFGSPNDSIHGFRYPPESKFPAFNVFPGETVLKTRLSSVDSVDLVISSAQIPRVITASYTTATYPALIDSTRSLWVKDTALAVKGPVSVSSITFPQIKAPGTPILYSESGATYAPGTAGAEGSVLFVNSLSAAKKFIPTFGGQNTPKGVQVAVKGLSTDTVLIFASVTRSGRTGFQTPVIDAGKKRWRVLYQSAKPFGFRDTTTAEGAGELKFGFGKTGVDSPFRSDSLSWLSLGGTVSGVTDSTGKYWGKTTVASSAQAIMIERLALGAGRDTTRYSIGDIVTVSAKGHQLSVDSSTIPSVTKFPDMGLFSKGYSFKWPGRAAGDSVSGHFKLSHLWALQNRPPQCLQIYATSADSVGSFSL